MIAFELSDVPALAKFGLTQMNWQALLAQLPSQLRVFAFANGLSNLGRYYLHDKTLVRDVDEVVGFEEPIDVDGLGRWQIGNTLLRGDDTALYYGNVLPAGMARTQALKDGQKTLATLKDTLATHLSKIGMTDDTDITLTSQQQLMVAGISLTADLPDQERTTGRAWVNLSLSRLSAKYLLRAWLTPVSRRFICAIGNSYS